ncbi:methytransferase partner Trm112 [Natrialbaceae archaeon GCM10025810]|uniref:methytransferase partner Trm112 n=1 Tax=Halovalidus salilacus TaxID=3075124 RepID=UPI00361CC2D7
MKESLLEILCCPLDKHDLELENPEYEDDGDEVVDGTLVCSECGERYPIEDGIPNLLPPDMRGETPA